MRIDPDVLSRNPCVVFVRMIGADIEDVRLGSHFLSEYRYRLGGEELGHLAVWVVQITKGSRSALAGVDARRLKSLGHPVQAEITFVSGSGLGIDEPRIIGAGQHAVFAADANIMVNDDNAVFLAFIGCSCRTNGNALRFRTLVA